MSDSWTSVGAETTADEDMMIDVDSEDKEAENTVSELGLDKEFVLGSYCTSLPYEDAS